MHQGANNNIFSFSDDEFERAQRNQHQNRRSDERLRVQSGFEAAAAAAADHPQYHLVPIEEEEEEEEEEGGNIYGPAGASAGAAGGATNINSSASMLSEMFNYDQGGPGGDIVLAAAAAHDQSSSNHPPGAYHRLIQQTRPDHFYGANNSRLQQGLLMMSSSAAAANINNNINNWMTGSVIEDAAPSTTTTTLAAPKQHHHHHHHHGHGHGTNYVPAEASADHSSPSTAMRLFFMNPAPTSTSSTSVAAMHHQRSSASPDHPADHQPPMVPVASMLRHDQSQAFLGGGAAGGATIFGGGGGGVEGISFGGGILRESLQQVAGPALSLSSSTLQQLEMRKADQELREARSQGSAAAFLFYNSTQQQQAAEQQLHLQHASSTIQQQPPPPPPPPSSCFQSLQAGHQSQEGQYQQLHMSSSSSTTYGSMSTANVLRNSKYARAAQELLEEFCSVSRGHVRGNTLTGMIRNSSINPPHLISHGASGVASAAAAASSSSSKDIPPLSPADRFEYQRKKSKLLSMLDEVERRYNHYCEQMQVVVNSFDSVMGFGAAMPYTALARKAMSKHFRCLKDAISAQLKQTCEVLGDNDGGSGSGLTKGETPKLRLIDQNLRQQRAFHQMGVMEQEAWRPQRGLPDRSVTILRSWLFEHFLHPYPSDADKHLLARKTGLSRNQVSNWFINARVRLWKPMVEDMYQQEAKEELEDSLQLNEDIHHETNTRRILLAAARTTQQQQQPDSTSPESDAPAETVSIPYRSQLDHYDRLRLAAAPITDHEPLPPHHDHDGDHTAAASNSLIIFPPPPLDDEMYRRAAAARTGDLSLTLGLRHAGGSNAPDTARFGL